MLTIEKLKELEPGEIFAQGVAWDRPGDLYMEGSGRKLRWLACRGKGMHDWAIYCHYVQLWKGEDGGIDFVAYCPRKNSCFESDETIPPKELDAFFDNMKAKFQKAIELVDKFKRGEIDAVYYWDDDK